ncbi:DUF6603 domain-containing protein [Streptomyces xantholiticus]
MTGPDGSLARLLREITDLLAALGDDVRDEEHALALLDALGVAVPTPPPSLLAIGASIAKVSAAADDYDRAATVGGPSSVEAVGQLDALSKTVAEAFTTLLALGPRLEADFAAYPGLLDEVDFPLLARRLVERAMVTYLRRRAAPVYNALALLGVADPQVSVDEGDFTRPYVHTQLRWERLKTAAQDPAALLADVYGWGTTLFDHRELLRRLHYLLQSLGAPVGVYPAVTEDAPAVELRLPLFAATGQGGAVELGLALGGLEATAAATDVGLVLQPYAEGVANAEVEPLPGWRIVISGAFAGAGLGVGLRPPLRVVLVGDLEGNAKLVLTSEWRPERDPILLVSQPDWFAITTAGFRAELQATIGEAGVPRLGVRLEVVGGQLTITPGEADGFLRKVMPPDGLKVAFDLGLAWSDEHGLRLVGSGGFEVTSPVHLSLGGILDVQAVYVALTAGADGGTATAAATIAVTLGPVRATVERIGFALRLTPAPDGGNLGTVELGPRFQPPKGAGLVIDAGPVSGDGYVLNDPDNGRYGGILQLRIADTVAVTAIGVIATKLPDGRRGFSLLVIITAAFPPIQLGLGFTLDGLGGLFGAHRSMDLAALQAGVRNRGIDSVLFPVDPVANAPRVIRDVEAFFPVTEGQFCVGLMAAIGWGTPTLVKAEIGIVVELPSPVRIALLGRLSVVLPGEAAPVVSLKVVVLGTIDFAAQELAIDASIYDSRIAVFAISGDFALRLNYGATPAFAVAIGGFNPRFVPPPGFPELDRVQISLTASDNPRLRLEAYLANTPTTVQAGARLDLYVEADLGFLGVFSASAWLYFDALVYLRPRLRFVVDLGGGISVARNGRPFLSAQLVLTIEGPQPVHGYGYAEIDFFGKHRLPIDVTVGPEQPPPVLPPGDPIPRLLTALELVGNWSAQLPVAGGAGLVQLREPDNVAEDLLLVHPFSAIAFSQRVAPLDVKIDTFEGAPPPPDAAVLSPQICIGGLSATGSEVREAFPAGQFFELSDDEKLTGEAFPRFCSGLAGLAPERDVVPPPTVAGGEGYETAVLNPESWWPEPHDEPYAFAGAALDVLVGTSAAGRAPTRTTSAAAFTGEPLGIAVAEKSYRLAGIDDLAPKAGSWATEAEADLERGGDAELQVVGAHEVGP